MPKIKVVFSLLIVISSLHTILAQAEYANILDRTYLEYVDRLPTNLTSEKSIGVLIADSRAEAEQLAVTAHPTFAKAGVDVVSYYHVDDLFAGKILSKPLAAEFVKREIIQLIFLIKAPTGYTVVITPFSKNEDFIKHGKKAWKMESSQLSDILDQLYRMSASLERKNFLVSDAPEFGRFDHRVSGRRYEAYKPDLKTERLAVPLELPIALPEEFQSGPGYETAKNAIIEHNQRLAERNQHIRNAFANYAYPHVFIEEVLTEKQLREKGYNYVLDNIHITSHVIRNLLKYDKKQGVTDYIVVRMSDGKGEVVRINGDEPVYKYYVRNIPSDTYYLGAKWDADLTLLSSLNNHVQLLISEIR
jgi:hypothetical protein